MYVDVTFLLDLFGANFFFSRFTDHGEEERKNMIWRLKGSKGKRINGINAKLRKDKEQRN